MHLYRMNFFGKESMNDDCVQISMEISIQFAYAHVAPDRAQCNHLICDSVANARKEVEKGTWQFIIYEDRWYKVPKPLMNVIHLY